MGVFAFYPFAENQYNASHIYDIAARESGFDIVAAHAPGTGGLLHSKEMRQRISSEGLGELAVEAAAEVNTRVSDSYSKLLGLADSDR